jgi:hypothetical protein
VDTVAATANVLCTLDTDDARTALRAVLECTPDLVCLQEWSPARRRLLRETGTVTGVLLPGRRLAPRRLPPLPGTTGLLWVVPLLGGCPVGVRADRFSLVEARSRLLAGPGRSDRRARPLPVAPPRFATVVVLRERRRDGTDAPDVCVISYHLTPGVQARGSYRDDRPHLVARHRRESARLARLVAEQQSLGRVVHAAGDSNFDGFRVDGLTSAWDGRPPGPGTLGPRRRIDDVHGPGRPHDVRLVETPSDHRAVVVRRG